MTAVLAFGGGLAVLLAAGRAVVQAASTLGARFGLSPTAIGLTIVAAGTSAPELAVVGQSLVAADTELAVGSIVGSNIANVLLVLGAAAVLGSIAVTSRAVRIDVPVMIGASFLFLVLVLDGVLSGPEGLLLLAALGAFVAWTLRAARGGNAHSSDGDAAPSASSSPSSPARAAGTLVVAIAVLTVSARFVVAGAEAIATGLGVPELVVGLTVVALGTSSPEIATTLMAAVQGRGELAVANAVGSNIFNLLLVLGLAGVVAGDGLAVSSDAVRLDLPVMLAAAVACLPLMARNRRLDRWEGVLFVAYYAAYLAFLALDGTGHSAERLFGLVMVAFVIPLTVVTVLVVVARQARVDTPNQLGIIKHTQSNRSSAHVPATTGEGGRLP